MGAEPTTSWMPSPSHPVAPVHGCARLCVNPAVFAETDRRRARATPRPGHAPPGGRALSAACILYLPSWSQWARAPASRRGWQGHLQCLAPGAPPEPLPLAHCMSRLHGAPAGSLRIGRCEPPRHTPSLQFREAHCRSNSQCAPTGSLARLGVASSMIRVPPSMRRRSIVPPASLSTRLGLRYRYLRLRALPFRFPRRSECPNGHRPFSSHPRRGK